jgi:hypothetical protein
VPDIIVEEKADRAAPTSRGTKKQPELKRQAERPVHIPRGSSSYYLPDTSTAGLPRTPLIVPAAPVAPYIPPPVDNPSARINQYNESFPLNRGLGNNPTDRDAYIRYQFNNR